LKNSVVFAELREVLRYFKMDTIIQNFILNKGDKKQQNSRNTNLNKIL